MKTLLRLLSERRAELQRKLDGAGTLRDAVSLLQTEFDVLQQGYLGALTVPQARAVTPMLELLRSAVAMLETASKTRLWHEASRMGGSGRPRSLTSATLKVIRFATGIDLTDINLGVLRVRVLQATICAGLLTSLATLTTLSWTAWPAILLILSLVLLEVSGIPRAGGVGLGGPPDASEGSKVTVGVDAGMLLGKLESALDIVDRTVLAADAPKPDAPRPQRGPAEQLPELLEVIQNLLAESLRGDAPLTLKRCEELPGVLARLGIQVTMYEPSAAGSAEAALSDWFDIEPSLDPHASEWRTLKPALIKGGRVLVAGRVVAPPDIAS